ncbi:hypothetical protein ABVT39_014231 [Epinephelus coioides]
MKMKAFVVFVILTHVSQHASSVGVFEGEESVMLPCQVSGLPKNIKVVWSRFDLNPSTVHQHQDKYEPYVQNQQYSSRTSMSADALKTGDLSLALKKPHRSDTGVYTCTVHNDKSEIGRQTMWLQVIVLSGLQRGSFAMASEGMDSVMLPFQVSRLPEDIKVVWSRLDLIPSTVHQHQDKYEPYLQNQQYSSRTSMSADALKTGDLSLTLKKPHHSDSGIYTCTVHNSQNETQWKYVMLQVTELPTFPAGAFAVLAVVFAVGLAVYFWYNTIPVSQVEVEEGVWLVKLPCKTKVQLPDYAIVEWSRCAPKPMMIHSYQNGSDQHVGQDEFYCDRTKMEKEPLKTGDLSLTLREPWSRDNATYICTVHCATKVWMQKVIRLTVKSVVKVVEIRECAKSVTLPFRTCVKLPGDATVEWCRMDTGTLVAARLNQSGKKKNSYRGQLKENLLQTGDLSLTLIKPTQADSSIYFCTVCGYGDVLLQRFVHLNVQGRGF